MASALAEVSGGAAADGFSPSGNERPPGGSDGEEEEDDDAETLTKDESCQVRPREV